MSYAPRREPSAAIDPLRARLLLARGECERCLEVVDRLPFVDTDEDGMEYGRNSVAQVKARALHALGRPGEAADALLDTLRTHGQLDGDLGALVGLLVAAHRSPAEIATRSRPEAMPVLVAMASRLPASVADEVLTAFVERYPDRLEPLAASSKVVGALPVARVMWWSAHLRRVGLGVHCPLVAMARDGHNEPPLRLLAAAGGYLLFADQRLVEPARAALAEMPASTRPEGLAAVAGVSGPLAELLTTTTVAAGCGPSADAPLGYVHFADPARLPIGPGGVHELAAADALAAFSRVEAGAVLGEWARVLCPGGRCSFEVPDLEGAARLAAQGDVEGARRALFGPHPQRSPRRDAWTRDELERWLPRMGFDIESIEAAGPDAVLRVAARRRGIAVRGARGPIPPASVIVVANGGRQELLAQLRALSTSPAGVRLRDRGAGQRPRPGLGRLARRPRRRRHGGPHRGGPGRGGGAQRGGPLGPGRRHCRPLRFRRPT